MLEKTLNVQTQGIKIIKVIFSKNEWENAYVIILNESIRKISVCLYRYALLIMQNNTIQLKTWLGHLQCVPVYASWDHFFFLLHYFPNIP